jgi:hypothetical protein
MNIRGLGRKFPRGRAGSRNTFGFIQTTNTIAASDSFRLSSSTVLSETGSVISPTWV